MLPCKLILLIFLIGSSVNQDLLSKFNQHKYKLKDRRVELESYNPSTVKYIKLKTFKYNRTIAVLNCSATFLIDIEDKMEVVVQAYKFASNEYRHFPMRFQLNVRKAFSANVGGIQDMKNCGNVATGYYLKDIEYYLCNFVPDERKFPPLIPTGRYKINLQFLMPDNRELFAWNFFSEVYVPIAIPAN